MAKSITALEYLTSSSLWVLEDPDRDLHPRYRDDRRRYREAEIILEENAQVA